MLDLSDNTELHRTVHHFQGSRPIGNNRTSRLMQRLSKWGWNINTNNPELEMTSGGRPHSNLDAFPDNLDFRGTPDGTEGKGFMNTAHLSQTYPDGYLDVLSENVDQEYENMEEVKNQAVQNQNREGVTRNYPYSPGQGQVKSQGQGYLYPADQVQERF